MDITLTIPDAQWQEFQQLAQEAVETKWNGSYEENDEAEFIYVKAAEALKEIMAEGR